MYKLRELNKNLKKKLRMFLNYNLAGKWNYGK